MSTDNNSKEPLMSHSYDGIQELDNPLPEWWLMTFFIAIIFSFIYWLHYDVGSVAPSQKEELQQDMANIYRLQDKAEKEGPSFNEEEVLALIAQASVVSEGQAEFVAKCAACHGQEGEGLIGPNLTDNYWIHGQGKVADIVKVVNEGVLDKGMPSWKGMIPLPLLQKVVAYVYTLKGTQVSGKEPQGEMVPQR